MAGLFEEIQSFFRAERSQRAFEESLRALRRNPVGPPPVRTSWIFDSHIEEANGRGSGGGRAKTPHNISLAWDDANFYGSQDVAARNWQSLTPRERKDILLNIYLNNPWVSACVDVIAKRITSGGLSIEPIVDKPDVGHLHQLEDFCLRINDDWDLLQYVRACITDELIFGDAYSETVWAKGVPYQLYKVDCLTMGYKTNRFGAITDYLQQMDTSREPNVLDAKSIIRWWFPHPRSAVEPFSPIERVQDAVNIDKKMVNWMTTFFQKGAKFPYTIEGVADENEADRFLTWFKANFTGEKNAHVPAITWGDAKIVPTGKGSMDMDFEKGLDRQCRIVLSAYHVPPATVGIIESGNIGGGTGEDQEKSFQYNTCDPIRHMYFEKFNFRIVQGGFGIRDYRVSTRYADYRTDDAIAKIQDTRIKNGSVTINETRQEMGKTPYAKGGDEAVIVAAREIVPVQRLDDLADEMRQQAQLGIQGAEQNLQQSQEPQEANGEEPPPKKGAKKANESAGTLGNTGVMIAFFINAENANILAIPGGEASGDLHVTLAYLGDKSEYSASEIDTLKSILADSASTTPYFTGNISGVARFAPPLETTTPVVALVNIPGIQEWRQQLVERLKDAGFSPADDFEYTPHITLAYIPWSATMPVKDVPPLNFGWHEVWLVVGDERYSFPLDTVLEDEDVTEHQLPAVQAEHYPGGHDHDQSRHGAWSPGSPHHDPAKHAKGAAYAASKAAAKGKSTAAGASKTAFPTSEQLGQAQLHEFGNSFNTTYKTTIGGKDYFVKKSQSPKYDPVEVAAYQAGKTLGIEDHLVPISQIKVGEQSYQVEPLLAGKPLMAYSNATAAQVAGKLSPEEFTKMHAYEYLMNDGDRHWGNYMVDEKQNLHIIDMGFATRHVGTTWDNSALTSIYAAAKGTFEAKLTFDKGALASVLSQRDAVLSLFQSAGTGAANIEGVARRFDVLSKLAASGNLSLENLSEIGYEYKAAKTKKAA